MRSFAWSPDSTRLASGSHDGSMKVWDPFCGRCLLTLQEPGDGASCAWSPEGTLLACGLNDGVVKVWDIIGGRCLVTFAGTSRPGGLMCLVSRRCAALDLLG